MPIKRKLSANRTKSLYKSGESGKHKVNQNNVNVDEDEDVTKCYQRLTKGGELDILDLIPKPGMIFFKVFMQYMV